MHDLTSLEEAWKRKTSACHLGPEIARKVSRGYASRGAKVAIELASMASDALVFARIAEDCDDVRDFKRTEGLAFDTINHRIVHGRCKSEGAVSHAG